MSLAYLQFMYSYPTHSSTVPKYASEHSCLFIVTVYGVLDLVRLPYYQYQEDGRILWGLQRGATAFTSSTGVAVVELTSRMLETVQSFAQMAYDLVSPSERSSDMLVHQHKPHEPLDLREGFANAYDVVYAVSFSVLFSPSVPSLSLSLSLSPSLPSPSLHCCIFLSRVLAAQLQICTQLPPRSTRRRA